MSKIKHRTTDPACMWHAAPSTRLGWWWFSRQRGKACSECGDIRRRSPDCRTSGSCILVDGHTMPCLVLR